MHQLFLHSVAPILTLGALLCVHAKADGVIHKSGTSAITLEILHNETGDAQVRFNEKRTWFDWLSDYAMTDCKHVRAFLVEKELWRSSETYGREMETKIDRFVATVYAADKGTLPSPLYTLTIKPEWSELSSSDFIDADSRSDFLSIRVSSDPYRNYDIATGRLLFYSDRAGDADAIYGDDHCKKVRYVAFTTVRADLLYSSAKMGREFIAVLNYASSDGLKQQAKLEAAHGWREAAKLAPGQDLAPELSIFKSAWVFDAYRTVLGPPITDPDHPQVVMISFKLHDGLVVEIPISNDRMDIEHAILPPNFTVSQID